MNNEGNSTIGRTHYNDQLFEPKADGLMIRIPLSNDDEVYPCAECGKLRSKNQGGTVFTVCEKCWDKHYKREGTREAKEREGMK